MILTFCPSRFKIIKKKYKIFLQTKYNILQSNVSKLKVVADFEIIFKTFFKHLYTYKLLLVLSYLCMFE